MEIILLLLLFPFAGLVAIFFISCLCLEKKKHVKNLPPGRCGWPILGETLDYFNNLKDPDQFVAARMAKYSDKVFRTSLLGQPMAILCGAQGNKFIFTNENKLVKSWWPSRINTIFPKSNKEESYEVPKLLHSLFKADSLGKYMGVMDQMMKRCIETDWTRKEGGIVRVGIAVKNYNVALVCSVLMGIEDQEVHQRVGKLLEKISKGVASIPVNVPGTALNGAVKASKELRKLVGEIIDRKKKKIGGCDDDVLSRMLVVATETGKYTDDADVASHIAGFLFAGYDSLTAAITFVMKYLADYPHVYDQVYKEQMEIVNSRSSNASLSWDDAKKMKYSWNVAREVLRLRPPGAGGFREAITDFTYGGFTIPKGWKLHWVVHVTHKDPEIFPSPDDFDPSRFEGIAALHWVVHVTHKDPEIFPSPDDFDPSRFEGTAAPPYTFVPFGAGPRMCPGNEYARLAILVFVHNVVTKFRWVAVDPCEKALSDPMPRLAQGFPVRVRPHNP